MRNTRDAASDANAQTNVLQYIITTDILLRSVLELVNVGTGRGQTKALWRKHSSVSLLSHPDEQR